MKKLRSPAEELAVIVLTWNLKTAQGQLAHRLARTVLGEDPDEPVKDYLRNEIIQLARQADMPRLEDLKVSILDMSKDQLYAKIRQIREDRILRKEKPKTATQKKERKTKVAKDLASYLEALTPEEREAFIKELEA
jgi:hypothetical protein